MSGMERRVQNKKKKKKNYFPGGGNRHEDLSGDLFPQLIIRRSDP